MKHIDGFMLFSYQKPLELFLNPEQMYAFSKLYKTVRGTIPTCRTRIWNIFSIYLYYCSNIVDKKHRTGKGRMELLR